MWHKKRHQIVVEIVRPFFKLHFKRNYKLKIPKKVEIGDKNESFIVLSNHVTTLDPLILGAYFKRHIYTMASIDLFEHKFIGKGLEYLVHPIPKEKNKKNDLASIKACLRVAKENQPIGIFPEGNRTMDGKLCYINPSIVKLLKFLKKPVVLFNILGGFGTDPRWGKDLRKGKMEVKINKILTYDEYKDIPNDELFKIIYDALNVDNYNYYNKYVSKDRAEYLERVLYICPVCGKMHTLVSKGNYITCSNCNTSVEYGEDLRLRSDNKKFHFTTLDEWYNYQLDVVENMEYDDNVIYQDDVTLTNPRLYKSKLKLGSGTLKMFKDRFEIKTEKKDYVFDLKDVEGVTYLGKKKLNIYYDNKTYQVFGSERLNCIKYVHLFYILKNKMENRENEFLGL